MRIRGTSKLEALFTAIAILVVLFVIGFVLGAIKEKTGRGLGDWVFQIVFRIIVAAVTAGGLWLIYYGTSVNDFVPILFGFIIAGIAGLFLYSLITDWSD